MGELVALGLEVGEMRVQVAAQSLGGLELVFDVAVLVAVHGDMFAWREAVHEHALCQSDLMEGLPAVRSV